MKIFDVDLLFCEAVAVSHIKYSREMQGGKASSDYLA